MILLQIRSQAQQQADKVLAEAQSQAEAILQQAQQQTEEIAKKAQQKAQNEAVESEKRAHSAAQLAAKQSILQEKQALIGQVLEAAKKALLALPEEDYFKLLLQMVQRYAQEGEGELILSANDLARMPKSFPRELAKVRKELKLSKQTADMNGGFLLVYGGIEMNCGFDALFAAAEDDMRDRAHEILFE